MSGRFTVTPAAQRDLDDLSGYLADEAGFDTALRFQDAAAVSFAQIGRMPGIGEQWPSRRLARHRLRVWRVEGFETRLIFYREAADGVEIVRLIHAARDINRELESGPLN